jgi:hypothetical protein
VSGPDQGKLPESFDLAGTLLFFSLKLPDPGKFSVLRVSRRAREWCK